jgi:hypothetical protein
MGADDVPCQWKAGRAGMLSNISSSAVKPKKTEKTLRHTPEVFTDNRLHGFAPELQLSFPSNESTLQ